MLEHKAFLFDHRRFEQELRSILEFALASNEASGLLKFVNENLHELRDPYEGDPLRSDWNSLVETPDAHQYGDFALTKYCDPTADLGLGAPWEAIQEVVIRDSAFAESPILGRTIGPRDRPFDPGKAGSYFQDEEQVRRSYRSLLEIAKVRRTDELKEAIDLLDVARKQESGLYVTF